MKKNLLFKAVAVFLLSAAILTVMLIPAYAGEYEGSCGDKLQWSLSGGVLTITGSGDMTNYSEYKLAPWYESAEEITAISLPEGLTSIGSFAFFGCKNLAGIRIPASVTKIGSYAFAECTGLLTANLGSGVTTIGISAFQQCEALTAISFPDSLQSIQDKAFYRCYGLSSVTVPSTVTYLGMSVFAYCTGLVRAVVNTPVDALPSWTFYGCASLTDVSLGKMIQSTGEYAFQGCEDLNAVYTQTGDVEVAYQIEQEIGQDNPDFASNGYVATYDIPDSSVHTTENGSQTVTETENAVISVIVSTNPEDASAEPETTVSATVSNPEGWTEISEAVEGAVNSGISGQVAVIIQLEEPQVEGADLAQFAGEDIILSITDDSGVQYQIEMSDMTQDSFSGTYDLSTAVTRVDAAGTDILSDIIYQVGFANDIDFNSTIGIYVNTGNAYQYASLYQKEGSKYREIQTVVVDMDGCAWFALANVDTGVDYFVGINVEGVDTANAVIPETLYDVYGIDATLMDASGTRYQVTGRASRWGISGLQFAIFVAIAIGAVVLVVALIMVTMNKISRSKMKYAVSGGEDIPAEIDEEAIRLQVMREMLGQQKKQDHPDEK